MNVSHRLQMILESTGGQLLLAVFFLLCVLTLVYFVLLLRQRGQDYLAYKYQNHYHTAQKVCENSLQFIGKNVMGWFGRYTVVTVSASEKAICLIPPPDLYQKSSLQRFREYITLVKGQQTPLLAPYIWTHDKDLIIAAQKGLLKADGSYQITLKEYSLDKAFGRADSELILLEIARSLGKLHQLKTKEGESLYYGVLVPSNIYLQVDSSRRIHGIHLADHGMAFALDPAALSRRYQSLDKVAVKKIIEPYILNSMQKQVSMLAPEQLDSQLHLQIGSASDYFAFATLAVTLFTKESFKGIAEVNWDQVPENWVKFLKQCLNETAVKRPKDFLVLTDRLYDPELALTHLENQEESEGMNLDEDEEISLGDLAKVLHNSKAFVAQNEGVQLDKDYESLLSKAESELSSGKFKQARKLFAKLVNKDERDPRALVGFAITLYEAGKMQEAEVHYERAKKLSPADAKRFREHIAFRV